MGIHWFVYSEDGVTCLRGQLYFQNKGCIGDPGDMGVGLNLWTKVELVTYNQGIWIARVYDQGGGAVDVATFPDTSVTIY